MLSFTLKQSDRRTHYFLGLKICTNVMDLGNNRKTKPPRHKESCTYGILISLVRKKNSFSLRQKFSPSQRSVRGRKPKSHGSGRY